MRGLLTLQSDYRRITLSGGVYPALRLRIRTYHASKLGTTLTWHKPIATVFHDTGVLSGFSRDAVCSDNETSVPTEGLTPSSITYEFQSRF